MGRKNGRFFFTLVDVVALAKDGDNLEDAKKQNGKRMLPYLQQKYLPPTRKHCFVYMSATSLK